MNRALKIILGTEIVLGILWTLLAAMAQGAGGLAVLGLFMFVYGLYAAFFVFAAWVYWKRPDERRVAGWIIALPILFWFLPMMIRSLAGGVLTQPQLIGFLSIIVIVAIAICWFVPRKAAVVIPGFLVRSTLFNWLVLLALIAGWLFLVFVVLYVANEDRSGMSTSSSGTAVAYAVVLLAIYLIGLGAGSFGVSTWAWVSLRGGFEITARKLNIAQLIVAAPGVLIGILVVVWLAGQGNL